MALSTFLDSHVIRIAGWRRMFRAVLISTVVLCAQSGDWAQVKALAPGAQVDVKRFSAAGEVRGTVESATDDSLVVQADAGTLTFDRPDVKRLRLRSDQNSKRGRITGAAIMGGLGAIGAAVSDGSAAGRASTIPIFAGIGYLIGWAADGPKRITLYKGEKP